MDDETKIDRLLAGEDRLSPPEKEELFDEIYEEIDEPDGDDASDPERSNWPWQGVVAVAALLAVVSGWGLWQMVDGAATGSDGQFRSRGGGATSVNIFCIKNGNRTPCRRGRRLAFRVRAPQYSHFAAFAKREDGPVIWYFPEQSSAKSYPLRESRRGVIDEVVRLGEHHRPGTYRIWAVLSKEPLSRETVRQFVRADAPPEVKIVQQTVTVR